MTAHECTHEHVLYIHVNLNQVPCVLRLNIMYMFLIYIRRICSYFYIALCDSLCSLLLAFRWFLIKFLKTSFLFKSSIYYLTINVSFGSLNHLSLCSDSSLQMIYSNFELKRNLVLQFACSSCILIYYFWYIISWKEYLLWRDSKLYMRRNVRKGNIILVVITIHHINCDLSMFSRVISVIAWAWRRYELCFDFGIQALRI